MKRIRSRLRTVAELFARFAHRQRFFFIPLLVVLLLAGLLLAATGGLAYVAPFFYAIF